MTSPAAIARRRSCLVVARVRRRGVGNVFEIERELHGRRLESPSWPDDLRVNRQAERDGKCPWGFGSEPLSRSDRIEPQLSAT